MLRAIRTSTGWRRAHLNASATFDLGVSADVKWLGGRAADDHLAANDAGRNHLYWSGCSLKTRWNRRAVCKRARGDKQAFNLELQLAGHVESRAASPHTPRRSSASHTSDRLI